MFSLSRLFGDSRSKRNQNSSLKHPAMDLSPLTDAMAAGSYVKIADICDNLMLQASAEGINFQNDWPYAIHLLAHIYNGDINSARFLWKSIPVAVKESQPEVIAVWNIGQKLWTKDYAAVYQALSAFNWSSQIQPFVTAFSGHLSLIAMLSYLRLLFVPNQLIV
ncbi:COP9 signalosome complex subunit 8-like [Silene latifolia]|uniref:COP9 signalosome complex subunit 8-like n=1 Tax=Silene latifolia TaxID=37657 RepID=UPI003D77B10E